MKDYLFHKDVFLPKKVTQPVWEDDLEYTTHAKEEAQKDRYGLIELPLKIDFNKATLIEAEAFGNDKMLVCTKQVWRVSLDSKRDLCVVVTREGRVKTVWVNLSSDKHITLKSDKYSKSL